MAMLENDNPRIERLRMLKQVWYDMITYGEVDMDNADLKETRIVNNYYEEDLLSAIDKRALRAELEYYFLTILSPREARIIKMRFGIGREYVGGHTLQEVGQEFNVTRERIRCIEANCLCKLKESHLFNEKFNLSNE